MFRLWNTSCELIICPQVYRFAASNSASVMAAAPIRLTSSFPFKAVNPFTCWYTSQPTAECTDERASIISPPGCDGYRVYAVRDWRVAAARKLRASDYPGKSNQRCYG